MLVTCDCVLLTESTRTNVKVVNGDVHALGSTSSLCLEYESVVPGNQLVVGCLPLADCCATSSPAGTEHTASSELSDSKKTQLGGRPGVTYAVITVTIRLRRIARACFHSTRAKMNMSIFRHSHNFVII